MRACLQLWRSAGLEPKLSLRCERTLFFPDGDRAASGLPFASSPHHSPEPSSFNKKKPRHCSAAPRLSMGQGMLKRASTNSEQYRDETEWSQEQTPYEFDSHPVTKQRRGQRHRISDVHRICSFLAWALPPSGSTTSTSSSSLFGCQGQQQQQQQRGWSPTSPLEPTYY